MRIRKTQGVFVLAARHQHDLVAALSPGMGQGALQQRAPPAIAAVDGVCHHILNDAIGAAGAREVGDDGQRAGRNQLAFIPPSKVPNAWVGERLIPYGLHLGSRGQRVVMLVQVGVQAKQRGKVFGAEFADVQGQP